MPRTATNANGAKPALRAKHPSLSDVVTRLLSIRQQGTWSSTLMNYFARAKAGDEACVVCNRAIPHPEDACPS